MRKIELDISHWISMSIIILGIVEYMHNIIGLPIFNNPVYFTMILYIVTGVFLIWKSLLKVYKSKLLFLIIFVLSTVMSYMLGQMNLKTDGFVFHKYILYAFNILVFVCCYQQVKLDNKQICRIMNTVLVLGVISCVYAMIFQRDNLIGYFQNARIQSWRYESIWGQRNQFAMICWLAFICALYLYRISKLKRYLVIMVVLIFNVYVTNSRAGLGAILIVAALYILGYLRRDIRKAKLYWTIGVIFVSLAFVAMYADELMEVIKNYVFHYKVASSINMDNEVRFKWWYLALREYFQKSPIFGFGFDSVKTLIGEIGNLHNAYLMTLFEMGIAGIIYLVYFFYLSMKSIRKCQDQEFLYVISAGVIALACHMLLEDGTRFFSFEPMNYLSTILLLYLPLNYERRSTNNEQSTTIS